MLRQHPQRRAALDYETKLITKGAVHPPPMCMGFFDPPTETKVLLTPWDDNIPVLLKQLLTAVAAGEILLVNQFLAYDAVVSIKDDPSLYPYWAAAYESGNVGCTKIRAKFIEVQTHGGIETELGRDGSRRPLSYTLADLMLRHMGEDISELKKGEDAWRLRYGELENIPKAQWPEAAYSYAIDDPEMALRLWDTMTERHGAMLQLSMEAERLANMADFTMCLVKDKGIRLDPVAAQKLLDSTRRQVLDTGLLEKHGLRSPMVPSQPHKGGNQDHVEGCPKTYSEKAPIYGEDGNYVYTKAGKQKFKTVKTKCDCPVHISKFTPRKANDKPTREFLRDWLRKVGPTEKCPLTDTGIEKYQEESGERELRLPVTHEYWDEKPLYMKIENELLAACLVDADEDAEDTKVVLEYLAYKEAAKLWSSFIPSMMWDKSHKCAASKKEHKFPAKSGELEWADRVHGNYDIMKRTSRMSCFGSAMFPSQNHQQADPRARTSYIADPGMVMASTDFASIELYGCASTWKEEFGESKLHDLLMAGHDPHGFLGAALLADMATEADLEGVNPKVIAELRYVDDEFKRLEIFEQLKHSDVEEDVDCYKFWRTLAKPVGLGLPGGLGVATMRSMAFSVYGIRITMEQAEKARELWLDLFPEARRYLKQWIYSAKDSDNSDEEGKPLFQYTSLGGLTRKGCTYTAACNGNALQTPAAEGLKLTVFKFMQACMDPNSPLYGAEILAVIHDEILYQVPIYVDYSKTEAAFAEAERIMVKYMSEYLGIAVKVETEVFFRWMKYVPKDAPWANGRKDFDDRRPIDPPPVYLYNN